jgi:hypothetical protein
VSRVVRMDMDMDNKVIRTNMLCFQKIVYWIKSKFSEKAITINC